MGVKEAQFSYEDFMKRLGLDGDFDAIRNVIVSLRSDEPYIEVVYLSSTSTKIGEDNES